MPIMFDRVAQINSIKIAFLKSSHQNFSNDIYFVWSAEVRIFPIVIVFYYDVISSHVVFKFTYSVEL